MSSDLGVENEVESCLTLSNRKPYEIRLQFTLGCSEIPCRILPAHIIRMYF